MKKTYDEDVIGIDIDNEDGSGPGVYTNRQAPVDCVADQDDRGVILVGLYPSEAGNEAP